MTNRKALFTLSGEGSSRGVRRGGGGSNTSTFTFLSDVGALDLRFNTACRSCSDDDDDDDD